MANDIRELDKMAEYMNSFFEGTKGEMTLVEMYDKAVADNCTNEDGTCTNENHLHIGDYVDYENPKTGKVEVGKEETGVNGENQVFEVANNQLNWRVLGKDKETGGIKLISGRPVKSNKAGEGNPYLSLGAAKAYLNGETILNNIGKMYENKYAEKGRSVNQNDIDEITGITTIEKINEVNIVSGKAYGEVYSFNNQYTPESLLNGKQKTTVEGKVNGYAYTINSSTSPTVTVGNKRIYNMLFENVQYRSEANYWLASRSVNASSNYACFCISKVGSNAGKVEVGASAMLYSNFEDGIEGFMGVRPVIILKSNIQKSEMPKIADKTEEEWNY